MREVIQSLEDRRPQDLLVLPAAVFGRDRDSFPYFHEPTGDGSADRRTIAFSSHHERLSFCSNNVRLGREDG